MPEPHLERVRVPRPPKRRLQAFAFDPSMGRQLESLRINHITIPVPWERLRPGPVGEYLEVVDVDPGSGVLYPPVDLERRDLLAQDGLTPSEGNPQFHQQMVYAVAMATIARFEKALGRRVLWSEPDAQIVSSEQEKYIPRLRIYPHALREANAYYSPELKALCFGYFLTRQDPTNVVDGGMVFCCLSHDIIVHSTIHALLDGGLEIFFKHNANPEDGFALHEGLADLVTLLQRLTYPEVVAQQITYTRGDLTCQSLIGQIAMQFGQESGIGQALRDAISEFDSDTGERRRKKPDPTAYGREFEPHARGMILVSAVMDAFLAIYQARTADLLRLATGGTEARPHGEIHPDLVNRLAKEAIQSAEHILNMCLLALDYLPPPPMAATFGDYLRALITADYDMDSEDRYAYRTAFIETFWRHGITLRNVRDLSVESLLWRPPDKAGARAIRKFFGGPKKLRSFSFPCFMEKDRRQVFSRVRENRLKLLNYIHGYPDQAAAARALQEMWLCYGQDAPLSIDRDGRQLPNLKVGSVRPALRITPEGDIFNDLLILITQTRRGYHDPHIQDQVDKNLIPPPPADFILHGGCTLIIDLDSGEVRYAIGKRVDSERRLNEAREFSLKNPAW